MLNQIGSYLSLPQVQRIYSVSRPFLYQLRREKKLRFHYLESKPFIKVSEWESLFRPEDGKEVSNG